MDLATEDLLAVLPAPGEWRDEDYLWVTRNTRRLVELNAGKLEILPVPTQQHQLIVAALFLALHSHLSPKGVVLFAPLRLRIEEGRFREPDLVAMLSSSDPRRGDAHWTGADLVVEVLSPDDPNRDLVTKRAEYALAGVPEYWVVDPRNRSLTVLLLAGHAYREHGVYLAGSRIKSATLTGFEVPLDRLFETT